MDSRIDPPVQRWPIWALPLAWSVPTLLGLPFAIVSLRAAPPGIALWRALVVAAVTWQIWTLLTVPVLTLADRFPLERPWRPHVVAVHAAASLAAGAAQAFATALAFHSFIAPASTTIGSLATYMFLRFAPAAAILYAAIVVLRGSQVQRARASAREAEARALADRLAEVQLEALRAQLRPHFLFNALNATIALVRDGERERAADALTAIAALLRATLRVEARQEVSLEEELELVEQYLAIERLRMGDRLRVKVEVPESLLEARVPSLCLQPFVENAVRHGLRDVPGEALVSLSAREEDGRLRLLVTDNGVGLAGMPTAEEAMGIGVGNARARLALLHGAAASVTLGAGVHGQGTTAELILPLARGTR